MARIHHLNCATMCPYNAKLMAGEGGWTEPHAIVAHVLLVESDDGLVLVDTGLGTADVADPSRTGGPFRALVRPKFLIEETAIERIRALGFQPADVRHIVMTHLDVDHAGGLGDFPGAEVHIFKAEMEAALDPGLREKLRYIQPQWAHGPRWVPYETEGDTWFGFDSVRAIEGIDTEVAIVPLPGHTRGHSAVAVRGDDGWLLHGGDSYFHRGEIQTPPAGPIGLRVFQGAVELDRKKRLANQERLRTLNREHSGEIDMFCAHDPHDFARLSGTALPGC